MCYRICFHSLRCDSRPLVHDNLRPLVDPYAKPHECHDCVQDTIIKPRLRCYWHSCCIMTAKIVRCRGFNCVHRETLHSYERRPNAGGEWNDIKVFDGLWLHKLKTAQIFPVPERSTEVKEAVKTWLRSARYLAHLQQEKHETKTRVRVARKKLHACKRWTKNNKINCDHVQELHLAKAILAGNPRQVQTQVREMHTARELLESADGTRGTVFDF